MEPEPAPAVCEIEAPDVSQGLSPGMGRNGKIIKRLGRREPSQPESHGNIFQRSQTFLLSRGSGRDVNKRTRDFVWMLFDLRQAPPVLTRDVRGSYSVTEFGQRARGLSAG